MSQLLLDVLGNLDSTEEGERHSEGIRFIPSGGCQVADEISIGH